MWTRIVCALILIIKSDIIDSKYENQPKVYSKSDVLVLEAALDRNISLRLSADSSLLINDVDIMDKIRQRYTPATLDDSAVKQLDVPTTEQIQDEFNKLHDDVNRLSRRLSIMQNRTRTTLQTSGIRRYMGRVRRLTGRIAALEQNIAKDECVEITEPCKNGGTCYDSYKDYHCECPEGWTGRTCEEDVDECYLLAGTDLGCQNNAVCTNTPGSYKCTCAKGFSGTHCRLRNSVCQRYQSEQLCNHGICIPAKNLQGYTCVCDQGWSRNTTAPANSTTSLACAVDVDECEETRNPCHSECINLPGSFKCGPCPVGYTGNGISCYDIDECATNNGGCSIMPKVRCINAEGSFRCGNCPIGWIGDGRTCDLAPSNSCDAEKICYAQAKCEYISDVATCTCPHGMFGHGFGPEGCHTTPITDSCEKHICQNNGTCISTGRSTRCLCPIGYSGALCETADGCHPNPCENFATCKPQANQAYKCSCIRGTTGKRCEVTRSVCATIQRRPSGELSYPSDGATEYVSMERCAWIIRTTPSNILNLTFTAFDVEEDAECSHDWLQIHDGNSLASQLIGRFCGKNLPLGGNILSSQHQLFFWFRSDNATNRPGFHMTWESQEHVCGDTLDLSLRDAGVIRSPGYPGKTPTNRECQWELTAPYGTRFVIRIYEINMGARPNCTGDSLKIYDADFLLSEYCQAAAPAPIRTSSNKLKLHFHTDAFGPDSSFQLHYEVESSVPHCGGVFTTASGIIVGPTDQATCLYLVQQPSNTQINLEFTDISPFHSENCNLNSIEIFDGKTDEDPELLVFCGGQKPEPVVTSSNYLLIRYKNKLQGFVQATPFKMKYNRVCEFRLFGSDAGVFTTPNYPSPYTEHITCTFHIYGPAKTVVHANFTDFSLAESKDNNVLSTDETMTVSNNQTNLANSQDDSITYVDVYLSNSNKHRFTKGAPMQLISELNKMTIVFHATTNPTKARGLRVEYSFENVTCGGVYTKNNGSIFNYGSRPDENKCKYIIEAPEGSHVNLTTQIYFGSEHHQVLIYGNGTDGKDYLLKNNTIRYKETEMVETFKFNVITIFSNTFLFAAKYNFVAAPDVCGGNFSTLYGVIRSPNWPKSYDKNLECIWIISAPIGSRIELKVQNFTLEAPCTGDMLQIRNGPYATSPLIGRYCGDNIPSRIPSFTNSLYLRFTTDDSIQGSGFEIVWEQTATGCGGKLTSYTGSIHAPVLSNQQIENEISSYVNELTCDWQIHVAQSSSVIIKVTPSNNPLEFCRSNRLQIYDGSSDSKSLMQYNCSKAQKEGQIEVTSTSNQVLIVYTSLLLDSDSSQPEFILDYETNCNMVLDHVQGVIESPNFPELYPPSLDCNWIIKAGANNKIKLAFSHLSLEASNMECEYDYVEVWDMKNDDVLKKHHLCQQPPEAIASEGNQLRVSFTTDYANNKNGFRAEYTRVGCGEYMTKPFGTIDSPNQPYSVDMECDWYIEVPAGRQITFSIIDFHIDTDKTDCASNALVIRETKNSSTTLFNGCSTNPGHIVVTSPTNRLYVLYRSDATRVRKYFRAIYYSLDLPCGGRFLTNYGIITSPNYPLNTTQNVKCKWDLTVPEPYGVIMDFKDFDLKASPNCSETYLKIFRRQGLTDTLLQQYCGTERPSLKLMHTNHLILEYSSGGSTSYGRFSMEFRKQCGGDIAIDSGYIQSMANEECLWKFNVSQGTLISLNILQLDCYCPKDDKGKEMCNHGLGFKENNFDSDPTTVGNYSRYYCEQHQSNLVFEVSTLQVFANNINFRAQFSTIQHSCGGYISSSSGTLASPYYPASYPSNVECTWTIQASLGNRLQLQFDEMDIAESEHCNEDFLEVRKHVTQTLYGVYCGKHVPDEVITSPESLWIRFRSSEGSTGNGFKLKWSYAHLNEITNKSRGIIQSPPDQMVRHDEVPYAWRIFIERGKYIELIFDQYNEGLMLYDGFDDTALQMPITTTTLPWRFVSSSNVIYLKSDNDNFNYFFIRWNISDNKTTTSNTTTSDCHTESFIQSQALIVLTSPKYPNGYDPDLHCDWIYKPKVVTYHIVAEIYDARLEVTNNCVADYLKISSSTDLVQWHEMEKLCNSTENIIRPFRTFHGTPNIKLDFVTDATINRTGFQAYIKTECGSNLTQSVGFIDGEMLMKSARDCLWHITVKPTKRILLQLDYPPSIVKKDSACLEYALIYDGLDEHAALLGLGKFCNPSNVSQIILNSTTNYLTIKYKLDLPMPLAPRRWNLTYREYSECNEEYRLIDEAPTINVTSPNYPNVPHPHSECEWRIVAPRGEIIQVDFVERFDMNARFCSKEFVEFFDGSTALARNLGKHCRKPTKIRTTQNVLYMHYLTDINEPRSGFKARISISKCGGSYDDSITGVIKSTGYPNLGAYPSNTQCDYAISLPGDSKIHLIVLDIHLPYNLSIFIENDYLEIIPLPDDEKDGENVQPVLLYGNTTNNFEIDLNANKAIVRFHTFGKSTQYRGFALKYNRFSGHCQQDVNGISGNLVMNFPKKPFIGSYCRWKITVPKGQRVRLELINMDDLKEHNVTRYPSFSIFNDHEMMSKIMDFDVNTFNANTIIQSTDNVMMVRIFVPIGEVPFKALKARYSSNELSPCPANIDENNQSGLLDIRKSNPIYKSNYYCLTKIKLSGTDTLVFNISTFEMTRNATAPRLNFPLNFRDSTLNTVYRENLTQVLQPHNQIIGFVRIMQSDYEHINVLRMDYRLHKCGGYFGTKTDFAAKQPEITDINYGAIMCVWTLARPFFSGRVDSQYKLVGNFSFSDSCDREFIMIKEGQWKNTNPTKKICRDSEEKLEDYILTNRLTFIVYQAENYISQTTQFSMQTKKTIVCGSETKVAQMYSIVELKKDDYKDNQECSWVFFTPPGNFLQLQFYDRFFIQSSANCSRDYLEVQHYEDNLWMPDLRYCGRELPAVYNSSQSRIRLVFHTDDELAGDGFSLFIRKQCFVRVNVTSTTQQLIPGPTAMGYRGNRLQCEYIFESNDTNKLINVRITFGPSRMQVQSSTCTMGFTPYKLDENGVEQAKELRCMQDFEERAYKYLRLSYEGFNLVQYNIEYNLDTCGGNINTSSTIIRPLKHESANQYADAMNCVWYVTAPADHSIAVRFKYFDTETNFDYVAIYSGLSPQSDKRVIQLTGNHTDDPPTVVVDHNQAIINAISDASNSARGFEAQVIFMPNCNERLSLTDGNSPVHLARTFKLVAGEEYMCVYRISAPESYRIRFDIKKAQINNSTLCSNVDGACKRTACNRLEIFDSASMQQGSMGKFCGKTNNSFVSSYNDALLKFNAEQVGQYSFEIILTMEQNVCGPLTEYTLGEEERLTLTFPQNGELTYAPNTHCSWHIKTDSHLVIHYNYIDLQNKSQITGKCLDYIEIKGNYGTQRYCGLSKDFSSYERYIQNSLDINFHSDATVEGRGFNLTIQRDKCNRTYNALSGNIGYSIYSPIKQNICYDTFMVPEKYNLNFYLTSMFFKNFDCQKLHFRLIDLKTNKTILDRCQNSYSMVSALTTTNAVRLETADFTSIGLTYTASDRNLTAGCGGVIQSSEAWLSSPPYEDNHNFSECRWNITVPSPNRIRLNFNTFDMGAITNCHLDNVKIVDVLPDGTEKVLKTLCGQEMLDSFVSASSNIAIISKKSPNFDGIGWTLLYQMDDNTVQQT